MHFELHFIFFWCWVQMKWIWRAHSTTTIYIFPIFIEHFTENSSGIKCCVCMEPGKNQLKIGKLKRRSEAFWRELELSAIHHWSFSIPHNEMFDGILQFLATNTFSMSMPQTFWLIFPAALKGFYFVFPFSLFYYKKYQKWGFVIYSNIYHHRNPHMMFYPTLLDYKTIGEVLGVCSLITQKFLSPAKWM